MRTLLSTGGLLLAAVLSLGRPAQAQSQGAVTINYAFGGFSFTAPTGDAGFRMAATPSPRTLTLLPGVAQTVNVQAVYFTVSPTSRRSDFTGSSSRTLSLNGLTQSVTQGYDLSTEFGDGVSTQADDSLTLAPGGAFSFDLGGQGTVKFTPEPIDQLGFFNEDSGTTYQSNVTGRFLLAPPAVPEASTAVSTGLLLILGFGALALRSRRRSVRKSRPAL